MDLLPKSGDLKELAKSDVFYKIILFLTPEIIYGTAYTTDYQRLFPRNIDTFSHTLLSVLVSANHTAHHIPALII